MKQGIRWSRGLRGENPQSGRVKAYNHQRLAADVPGVL